MRLFHEEPPLNIRPATPDDYEALLPLFLGLRTFSRAGHSDPGDDFDSVLVASREYLHEILARGADSRTLLATSADGDLAGYLIAVVHPPNPLTSSGAVRTGLIDELFVAEAARGSGAAGELMLAGEDWFREQGAERVEVGAYAWNSDALAFYKHHGFAPSTITLTKNL